MYRRLSVFPNLLAASILTALPVASAWAKQSFASPPPRDRGQDHNQDHSLPREALSDAVRRVERDTRGEVLSAERVQYDGRDMHRVKVVDDQGRVRVFMQEPPRNSGAQQKSKRDDD